MASVPRAARRGGKVEPSPHTTGTPKLGAMATPPTVPSPPADAKLPKTPVEGESPSPVAPEQPDTPSFLAGQGSLLQFNADASSHVAVGVVRGRGASHPVQERSVTAVYDEVASRVSEALSTSVAYEGEGSKPFKALSFNEKTDVLLVPDAGLPQAAVEFAVTNPEAKVLVVFPFPLEEPLATEDIPEKAVSSWTGNICTVSNETRLCTIDVATAQLHLHTAHGFAPFTHVFFYHHTANPIMYNTVWSEYKEFVLALPKNKKSTKIAIGVFPGSHHQETLSKYFAPLKVFSMRPEEPKQSITKFTADEVAALTKLPAIQSSRNLDDKNGVPLPPGKVLERVNGQAISLIKHLAENIPEGAKLRVVVFSGDPGAIQHSLSKECADSVLCLNSFDEMASSGAKCSVVTLTHVPTDTALNVQDVHVVLDLGTERGGCISCKAEQVLPMRRVEWTSVEESQRRLAFSGHCRPSLHFDLLSSTDANLRPPFAADATVTTAADNAVVQLARLGLDVLHVMHRAHSHPTADAMESAFVHLSERSAVMDQNNPVITFMGEMLARTGLNSDVSSFFTFGIVSGLHEVTAAIAAMLLHPLRPHSPAGKKNEDWVNEASEAIKKQTLARNSDIIADASLYIQWLEKDKSSDFATENVVEQSRLELVVKSQQLLLHRMSDFIIPSPSEKTPSELLQQLEKYSPCLEFFLAVALVRNAVTVRSEGLIAGRPATGSLLFLRTTKEVNPSAFAPSSLKWKNNTIVVPSSLNNTATKIFASGGSLIHQNFFFSALVLLSPWVDYSAPMPHKGEECVCFAVSVNKQIKRFFTDLASAARILEFREKWNVAFGAVQVKRSLPARRTRMQILSTLQSKDKKFDIDSVRASVLSEFTTTVEQCEMKEYQSLFQVHGTHRIAPNTDVHVENIATASDLTISQQLGNVEVPEAAAPAAAKEEEVKPAAATTTAPATGFERVVFEEDDDDIEVEGEGFFAAGPIIEEDE